MRTETILKRMTAGDWTEDNQLQFPALTNGEYYVLECFNEGEQTGQASKSEAEANIQAIKLAVNSTWMKGINPEQVVAMFKVISEAEDVLNEQLTDDAKENPDIIDLMKSIEKVLGKAKLNSFSYDNLK